LSSGDPINRIGYGKTIVFSLLVCAAGCGLFTPATTYAHYLGALFIVATGITILQIAANPFAAILGRPENAPARLNLAQGFNSLGTTIAPIIGGLLVYKVFSKGDVVTPDAIKSPYLIYGGICVVLALVIAFSKLPKINTGASQEGGSALSFPQLRFGMAAIFLYVGAEVAIGSYLVSFMGHESVMGWSEGVASLYLAYFWGGAMIGRLCGATAMSTTIAPAKKPLYMVLTAAALLGLIYVATAVRIEGGQLHMEFMKPADLIPYSVLIALCLVAFGLGRGKPGTILAIFSVAIVGLLIASGVATGSVALWAALGAGLFNSIMWSNIFTLAIDDLGEHTSQGSSLLVMMVVGGALFPLLMGAVADNYGIREAFFVPIISYVYIAWYGWWSQRRLNAKGLAA
jgi:FHS family L-fucose permease-like MFS transporter